jgi:hypothetical protein
MEAIRVNVVYHRRSKSSFTNDIEFVGDWPAGLTEHNHPIMCARFIKRFR